MGGLRIDFGCTAISRLSAYVAFEKDNRGGVEVGMDMGRCSG